MLKLEKILFFSYNNYMDFLKLTLKEKDILTKLEIKNFNDFFSYYPRGFQINKLQNYDEFILNERVCFKAIIISKPKSFYYGRNKKGKNSICTFKVSLNCQELTLKIFNQPWLKLDLEKEIYVEGLYNNINEIIVRSISQNINNSFIGIVRDYPLKSEIKQNEIRKIFIKNKDNIESRLNYIDEIVPDIYLKKHNLISRKKAIMNMHFATSAEDIKEAYRYLKYEELFVFYLNLESMKNQNQKTQKSFNQNKVENLINSLPFVLTKDQMSCIDDILNDLKSPHSMNRLLQGDVGSGKTVVAGIVLYANFLSGNQGVLLCPTEILAKQHYDTFLKIFNKININIKLFLGSFKNKEKELLKKEILNGDIDIVIGTHSVFQNNVNYNKLGLVINDEQHRFGVIQRKMIKDKSDSLDFLMMSATPIPRTLANILSGHLDISTIKTMPLGRGGCDSKIIQSNGIEEIKNELLDRLKQHKQIYIVAAAILENKNDTEYVESLSLKISKEFKGYNVSYLHGKMKDDEINTVMQDFINRKIDILISTTIIEVGLNVENATTMVVYNAERFGLSQLHQLRGRVLRGSDKGYFYMLTDKENVTRLKILEETLDGYLISEEDLKLRGPGDILGTSQSGFAKFKIVDFYKDIKIIEFCKKDAKEFFNDYINKEKVMSSINNNTIKNILN